MREVRHKAFDACHYCFHTRDDSSQFCYNCKNKLPFINKWLKENPGISIINDDSS